jgi:rhodanese-related sulfurtransferase
MKSKIDINIKIILLILTFSAVTGMVFNALNERGIPVFTDVSSNYWAKDDQVFDTIKNDTLANNGLSHASTVDTSISQKQTSGKDTIKNSSTEKPSAEITAPRAITLTQAYKLYKSGKALFIDARDQWDFQDEHIKGSINIPYYKFDKNDNSLKKLDKSSVIVTYCDEGDCGMSRNLARSLFKLGFTKTYYYHEGLEAWVKASYPVEKLETE